MIGRQRGRNSSVVVVKAIQLLQSHLEPPLPFQIPDRKADALGELTRKPGQPLKPGNGLPSLLTVRGAVRMPPGNDVSPSVLGLPAAIPDPDATGFLIQQGF